MSDWRYNARLGAAYLAQLAARFDGNVTHVAAAYNAGPSRPLRWMEARGDPRGGTEAEIVDWIEHIPFRETRNYVMRTAESLPVYRARPLPSRVNAPMTPETAARPGWGIFWMVMTGALFVGVTALVKTLGTHVPAAEAAFLRYAMGLVLFLPILRPLRRLRLTPGQWGVALGRGAAHTLAVALWFYAMARIPIADVTAMNYLSPVYVTFGAALFMGERLALRRVLAVVAALVGALMILRPGFREIGAGHMAMLVTAMSFGASYLLAKRLSAACSAAQVVALLSVTVTVGLAPLAALDWVTVSPRDLAILFGVACLATAGHYTMTLAFRAAPLTVTQPVTFLQLVWAVLLGALVFDEGVDPFVVLGGMVIVGAVSFITWREAVLRRQTAAPPASTP